MNRVPSIHPSFFPSFHPSSGTFWWWQGATEIYRIPRTKLEPGNNNGGIRGRQRFHSPQAAFPHSNPSPAPPPPLLSQFSQSPGGTGPHSHGKRGRALTAISSPAGSASAGQRSERRGRSGWRGWTRALPRLPEGSAGAPGSPSASAPSCRKTGRREQ